MSFSFRRYRAAFGSYIPRRDIGREKTRMCLNRRAGALSTRASTPRLCSIRVAARSQSKRLLERTAASMRMTRRDALADCMLSTEKVNRLPSSMTPAHAPTEARGPTTREHEEEIHPRELCFYKKEEPHQVRNGSEISPTLYIHPVESRPSGRYQSDRSSRRPRKSSPVRDHWCRASPLSRTHAARAQETRTTPEYLPRAFGGRGSGLRREAFEAQARRSASDALRRVTQRQKPQPPYGRDTEGAGPGPLSRSLSNMGPEIGGDGWRLREVAERGKRRGWAGTWKLGARAALRKQTKIGDFWFENSQPRKCCRNTWSTTLGETDGFFVPRNAVVPRLTLPPPANPSTLLVPSGPGTTLIQTTPAHPIDFPVHVLRAAQHFLVMPKLLPDLEYHERMKFLCGGRVGAGLGARAARGRGRRRGGIDSCALHGGSTIGLRGWVESVTDAEDLESRVGRFANCGTTRGWRFKCVQRCVGLN
ncbi:hypothetical protein B0H11DRAFT_2186405 [Mycena galericulata]|nr:hypothetical protein B0H11DRAFT_2186405 [Mycena galericulata]